MKMKAAGLFWASSFFQAPMADMPATPAPSADPTAAKGITTIAPKSPKFIACFSFSFSVECVSP